MSNSTSCSGKRLRHRLAEVVVRRTEREARHPAPLALPGQERVLHRLAFAEQVGNAAEVVALERARLRLRPEELHERVEQVRLAEVQEVEDRCVLVAPRCSRAFARVSGVTKVGVETPIKSCVPCSSSSSFGPGTPMSLMLMLMKPTSSMSRRDVRARPREADPGAVRASRLGEDPAPHVLGEVVADRELGADDSVRLRVAAALEVARASRAARICAVERVDDRLEALLLVRLDPLLGDREALVGAPQVDQPGEERA